MCLARPIDLTSIGHWTFDIGPFSKGGVAVPTFQYTVRDQAGKVTTGVKDAENQSILSKQLREQGFTVTKIKQTKAAGAKAGGTIRGGVKLTELSVFCR